MPTRTDFERACAYALDDLLVCTATGGSTTTVILSDLINTDTQASADRFNWTWIYGVSGALSGVQRAIPRGTYVPSTGQTGVTPGWSAPVNGTTYDLTSLFPRSAPVLAADTSYLNLGRAASRRINIRRRITVPITTSQQLSLLTWAEWIAPERVVRIWEPSPTGGLMPLLAMRRPEIIEGTSPILFLRKPFPNTGGVLTLDVVSPAYTWVNAAESTVGLTNETDTLLVPIDHMRAAMLVEAYRVLKTRGRARPIGSDAVDAEMWEAWCQEHIPDFDFGRRAPVPETAGVA